ncbi:hypothetical protein M0R45_013359 [Rubus argutus]|uniref:Maturase K n=1 Tax=Rubus argutus TaxID=59490 RepID=A0AAW1XKW6_RUBAR
MDMAIRCMPFDNYLLQSLNITHHTLPTMIMDYLDFHHLEHLCILKLNNTEIQASLVNSVHHQLPTTLRIGLIFNIRKGGTLIINQEVIRMVGSFTLRDLLHKLLHGSDLILLKVFITTI